MATDHNSNDDLISPVPEKKLKIDPTAYTSLYESFVIKQFEENSKNHLGFSETMENPSEEINYNMNQESKQQDTVSGRRKKARRRAKTRGKGSVENEKGGGIGLVFKCVEVKRDSTGLMYSREQMEGLRFVHKEYQLNKWVEVYCGLGPVVSKEYDALVVHHSEEHGVDFDPRKNFNVSPIMGGRHSQAVDAPEAASELIGCDLDSCTGTEGDCSEDDDSDSEYHSIQRPAFVVTGAPNFLNTRFSSIRIHFPEMLLCSLVLYTCALGVYSSAFYNLLSSSVSKGDSKHIDWWETERVQKVTFAKIQETKICEQTVYIPKIPEIVQCPQQLLPLKEWETALLNDFSELRLAISRYESSTSEVSGKMQPRPNILEEDCSTLESEIFHNPTDGSGSIQSSARDEEDASTISSPKILNSEDIANTPTLGKDGREEAVNLSTISCFIQSAAADDEDDSSPKIVTAEDIVNSLTLSTVLGIEPVARVSMLKKRIKLAEDMTSLSKNDCLWLFALCAAVDTPLNADTSASLRDLLRKCASLRAEKSELDDEVVMLNILATIAGKYFGQSDN